MPKFSIIIPVYNAEDHLQLCLSSACAQTYTDIEIVCVDDGSTDSSHAIITDRAHNDPRVRLIEKRNGGPSSARNAGIAAAKGEYVCFLDADDRLEPQACERMARELAGYQADAIVFGWSYEPRDKADRFVREHADVRYAFYDQFEPALLFSEMTNPYLRLAVHRGALIASGVKFDEDLRVGEDCQFLFALYPRIGSVRLIADKLYRYLLPRPGSIMADYKQDVESLCMCDLDMTISIFGNWHAGGFLKQYASHIMRWFVKGQLYTILRLPREERTQFVSLVRQLWLAYFSEGELKALELNETTARLVEIVTGASEDGELAVSERELSRALLDWRVEEYGTLDLFVTAGERAHAKLMENKHMLLKSPGAPSDSPQAAEKAKASRNAKRNMYSISAKEPETAPALPDDEPAATSETGGASETTGELPIPGESPIAAETGGARPAISTAPAPIMEEIEPVVSVVVPIYNVERYLDQALASIERQTLRALEIICVNDGSTDGSADILAAHAARDGRIRLIDKENGGYGSACNRGMSEARGTWIAIVEPDDWIDPNMYRAMVDYANDFGEPIDIVKTPYWRMWLPDTDAQRQVNCSYRGRIKPNGQPFDITDPGVTHLIIHHPSIWSALYSRDFIEDNGIKFLEIPGAGWADNPFLAETMARAESIVYLDQPFYHYREETPEKTESFARNSWRIAIDRWHDMADVYERLGMDDENVMRAHIRRGFTYLGQALEYNDPADPEIREKARSMFDRMDDALVFGEPNISPGSKQLYADIKQVAMPKTSPLPYAVQVVKGGLYNLVNTGPGMTFDTLKSFIGAHAKREGKTK